MSAAQPVRARAGGREGHSVSRGRGRPRAAGGARAAALTCSRRTRSSWSTSWPRCSASSGSSLGLQGVSAAPGEASGGPLQTQNPNARTCRA